MGGARPGARGVPGRGGAPLPGSPPGVPYPSPGAAGAQLRLAAPHTSALPVIKARRCVASLRRVALPPLAW